MVAVLGISMRPMLLGDASQAGREMSINSTGM
jgi:hypothetical protein